MEGTLAVVTCFAADFAPRNWAYCSGQILPIAQNQALFSLLGTTFGGNGQTTFALPDLRGRAPLGTGQGPGLSNINLGQVSGSETATLNVNQIPAHVHNGVFSGRLSWDNASASQAEVDFVYPAQVANAYSTTQNGNMVAITDVTAVINNAGSNQPIPIRSPYLGMSYIICLAGIFPSRN
jgi:microcystin-dependent protein